MTSVSAANRFLVTFGCNQTYLWRSKFVRQLCPQSSIALCRFHCSLQPSNSCKIVNYKMGLWKRFQHNCSQTAGFSFQPKLIMPCDVVSFASRLFHTTACMPATPHREREEKAEQPDEWETLMDNEDKKQNISSIPTRKENIFTIPNLLSLCRIIATPFIGSLILNGDYVFASSLLLVAAATDVLDGQIARRWPSQRSAFGSALDPLGDKILVTVITLALAKAEMLPFPLAFLIIGRDLLLVSSVFYLRYRTCPPPLTLKRFFDPTLVNAQLSPTFISKVNTVLQVAVLWASLTAPIFDFTDSIALKSLWAVTGVTTIWSGLSYVYNKSTVQILKSK